MREMQLISDIFFQLHFIPGSVAEMRDPNSSEGMMVLLNPGGIG